MFAQRLRDARKAAGLTQQEMGSRLGVGRPYVSELESGAKEPSDSLRLLFEHKFAGATSPAIGEEAAGYGHAPTRAQIESYFRDRLVDAEALRDQGGLTILYSDLVKHIPPDYLDHLVNLPKIDLAAPAHPASRPPAEKESRRRHLG